MITDQIASRSGKDFSSNKVSLPSAGKNGSRSGGSVTSVGDSRCHLYGLAVDGTSQWGCCPSGANYRSEYTAITQTFLILNLILKSCIRNFFSCLLDQTEHPKKKFFLHRTEMDEERGGILQREEPREISR
jgi:hypothetical protein